MCSRVIHNSAGISSLGCKGMNGVIDIFKPNAKELCSYVNRGGRFVHQGQHQAPCNARKSKERKIDPIACHEWWEGYPSLSENCVKFWLFLMTLRKN